jgi:hypothetical protein
MKIKPYQLSGFCDTDFMKTTQVYTIDPAHQASSTSTRGGGIGRRLIDCLPTTDQQRAPVKNADMNAPALPSGWALAINGFGKFPNRVSQPLT